MRHDISRITTLGLFSITALTLGECEEESVSAYSRMNGVGFYSGRKTVDQSTHVIVNIDSNEMTAQMIQNTRL